jgi:hypothetical protein
MFALKKLPPEAIPAALDRAEQYRREEQPEEAESICHDVLRVDPDNQRALAILLLALADRAGQGTPSLGLQPREILPKFRDPYDRAYYGGIVAERRALAMLHSRGPDSDAYDDLREAMDDYEIAVELRPGDADASLRWNACARLIEAYHLEPHAPEPLAPQAE